MATAERGGARFLIVTLGAPDPPPASAGTSRNGTAGSSWTGPSGTSRRSGPGSGACRPCECGKPLGGPWYPCPRRTLPSPHGQRTAPKVRARVDLPSDLIGPVPKGAGSDGSCSRRTGGSSTPWTSWPRRSIRSEIFGYASGTVSRCSSGGCSAVFNPSA
ncbi:MAG: hypothetical protein MZV70_35665 [Desulfobacterales bacterium]|nr:hypothetical protein [Desulfobacterales bacterium]